MKFPAKLISVVITVAKNLKLNNGGLIEIIDNGYKMGGCIILFCIVIVFVTLYVMFEGVCIA